MTAHRWQQLADALASLEAEADTFRIVPSVAPETIRSHLASVYGFDAPVSPEAVLADVTRMLREWNLHIIHPGYFGLFNPAVTPASVTADALVSAYNPQLAAWSHAPAANEIERHTLDYLGERFGLPESRGGAFTSGGLEANLTAVIAALTRQFPDYGDRGLRALPGQPVLYVSDQAHHSFDKIAHMTGLGRGALRVIPSGADLRMDLAALKARHDADRAEGLLPFMAVATAGTTAAGIIDPLPELAGFCRAHGLWYHVDAAWGGAAVMSPTHRGVLAGIERADSITCDAHKLFSVSMGAGIALVRDRRILAESFRVSTGYMPKPVEGAFDPYVNSLQWSRRFIGLKLFMTLAEAGAGAFARQIDHHFAMGDALRRELAAQGFAIVCPTPLPVVCFTHPAFGDGAVLPQVLDYLYRNNDGWISIASVGGRPVLRACITNFRSGPEDVRRLTGGLARWLAETKKAA